MPIAAVLQLRNDCDILIKMRSYVCTTLQMQTEYDTERENQAMYRRKPQGWLKHIDFFLLDIGSLMVSFLLATIARHREETSWLIQQYLDIFSFYLLTVLLLHVVNNTFSNVLKRGYYLELAHTIKHVAVAELMAIAYLYFAKQANITSRTVVGLVAVFYVLLSYVVRILWKRFLYKRGTFTKPASLYLIVSEDLAETTVHSLNTNAKGEYQIQGMCLVNRDGSGETIAEIPVTSNLDTVLDHLRDKWVDEVYVALPEHETVPNKLVDTLTEMGIAVHIELDPAGSESWQIRQVQYVGGKLVQTVSMTNVATRNLVAKRMLDIVGGIVGCLITAVLTLILGPLIYIQSPGPIFFAQTRVGKNGKLFKMYKFRSMYPDAEARKAELMKQNRISDGMMFKLDADPRIIGCKILPDGTVKKGIGNFIRDFSLDEFPQFFNVLKGELSLVGTRPPTVDEWNKYQYHHRARLAIKPGITGLWQVSGRSNITDFEQVVELDKKYIREWNFGMDLKILLKTVLVVLGRDGSM